MRIVTSSSTACVLSPIGRWDIFCQVVDNLGDAGFCWRLSQALSSLGVPVTLWIDQPQVLTLITGAEAPSVRIRPWQEATPDEFASDPPQVLIETFGCALPTAVRQTLQEAACPPLWINLEHLAFSSRQLLNHGLPSPQWRSSGSPLAKWFFVPGLTPTSGGLLREDNLRQRQAHFDGRQWLSERGWAPQGSERVVMAFCYAQAPLQQLLQAWSDQPLLVLVAAGTPIELDPAPGTRLRVIRLPWLPQNEFDHLLWSCDLNIVRGEDSLVRACWAGQPFVWQAYPRADGGQLDDLAHWLEELRHGQAWPDMPGWTSVWWALNGQPQPTLPSPWAHWTDWRDACLQWRAHLTAQTSLVQRLIAFVNQHRAPDVTPQPWRDQTPGNPESAM